MKVLIKRSESQTLANNEDIHIRMRTRVNQFMQRIVSHSVFNVNFTVVDLVQVATQATTINVAKHTQQMECCFTHRRRGNREVTFRYMDGQQLVTRLFTMQPQYVTAMQSVVLISNYSLYLNRTPNARRSINYAAKYLYKFVKKISTLDQ